MTGFKVIRVSPEVHKYLKQATAAAGMKTVNDFLKTVIDNIEISQRNYTGKAKVPIRTRYAGEPL
jgi:predicted HicB family RNase H-like nuclease